jgi:hypothetical protein
MRGGQDFPPLDHLLRKAQTHVAETALHISDFIEILIIGCFLFITFSK